METNVPKDCKTQLERRLERALDIIRNTPDDVLLQKMMACGLEISEEDRKELLKPKEVPSE